VVEGIERQLGDAFDTDSVFSFSQLLLHDERDDYPEAACAHLNATGHPRVMIPASLGGDLISYEHLLAATRALSRRDLTIAVAVGQSFLGAVPVWLRGSPEQQRLVAAIIGAGGQGALALTEEEHGSDLLACEVRATRDADAFRLSGTKWLINNGTRGRFLTVFARTDSAGGPRGFSLILVDKQAVDADAIVPLSRKRTHGIRGADISGATFRDARLPLSAMVGGEGEGLELTLKALQISRTMCAGFSLGAADTALRTTLDFAVSRKLYGASLATVPMVARALSSVFADLLLWDGAALAAARGLHVVPSEMSVWSAVIKYAVPVEIERILRELAVVHGARHYLRSGVFQKIMRDVAVVSLFDGNTAVNLQAITLQLRSLLAARPSPQIPTALFRVTDPLPPFDGSQLDLANGGNDTVMRSLDAPDAAADEARRRSLPPAAIDRIFALASALAVARQALLTRTTALWDRDGRRAHASPEAFAIAGDYARLHGAAAALFFWRDNDVVLGELAGSEWIDVAVCRTLLSLNAVAVPPPGSGAYDFLLSHLLRLHRDDLMFSLLPARLASRTP
jgi:alkylation response protein AidB-like acyl-CoA dehydrogenase